MLRYFLVLAVTDGSLLVASFVLGLLASGEPRGPRAIWHGVHVLVALLTTMATLAVHSIVYTYFLATGKWAKEVVRVYQLPDWINDQAKKNKRKAFRFEFWGMTLIAVDRLARGGGRHAGAATRSGTWASRRSTLAFNFGAFVVEYAVIVAQARLLLEVKAQADRLREARYGAEARSTAPDAGSTATPDRRRDPDGEGEPPLMSPLGIVVSIVLVDLLGFTIVMPLLAPFAEQYGFSTAGRSACCSPPIRCASSSPGRSWAG